MSNGVLHITIGADSYLPSTEQLLAFRELRDGIASIDGLSVASGTLSSPMRPGVPYNSIDWREVVVTATLTLPSMVVAELLAAQLMDWLQRHRRSKAVGGLTIRVPGAEAQLEDASPADRAHALRILELWIHGLSDRADDDE